MTRIVSQERKEIFVRKIRAWARLLEKFRGYSLYCTTVASGIVVNRYQLPTLSVVSLPCFPARACASPLMFYPNSGGHDAFTLFKMMEDEPVALPNGSS